MRKDSPYYLPSINVLQSATLFHGVVELFAKVKSVKEAEKAMQIALSTKGVSAVEAFFLIKE